MVYLLRCADRTLYTGVTADLERRLRQHNGELAGGARYTQGRRPVQLVWCEHAPDRAAAQRREAALKRLSRTAKEALVANDRQR
jgi:putative endonuclease